jgi:hypothetical protein
VYNRYIPLKQGQKPVENTPVQQRIIRTYEALAEQRKIYPTFKVLAKKARVSIKYAHRVIKEWKAQNKSFGIIK